MLLPNIKATTKGKGEPRSANIDDITATYMRTILASPVDVHLGAGGLSVIGLRALARTPHVAAIIRTRVNQLAEWCKVQDNQFSTGFRIRPIDRDMSVSRQMERDIRDATDLILNGGGMWFPGGMEGVARAVGTDSLIGDMAYFEPVLDGGRPVAYVPVDPATIRRWMPDGETPNRIDYDEKYAFVQYVDQEPRIYYKQHELASCVRNPRSWNYIFGYGHPELEELISIVAWLIHALATNGANYLTGMHGNMMLVFKTRMKKGRFQAVERMVHAALSGVRQNRKTSLVQLDSTFDESIEPVELGKNNNADMQYSDWINFLVKTACFPPGEPVTMADGRPRPIEDVRAGDLVMSSTGRPRRVVNTQTRKHRGELIHLSAGGRTIRATGEHPFLVSRCSIDGHMVRSFEDPVWVRAEDIVEGLDYLVIPKPKPNNSPKTKFIDLGAHTDLERNHVRDDYIRPKSNRATSVRRFVELTPENAFALGLYIAEGCGCVTGSNVQFSFGPGEEMYAECAAAFFERLGVNYKTTVSHNSINVVGYSSALSSAMRSLFGHKAVNVKVPDEIMQASADVQRRFVSGYLAGDGSCWGTERDGDRSRVISISIASASRTAADQVQHMLLGQGVYTAVYRADRGTKRGQPLYQVRASGETLLKVAEWLEGPKGDKLRALVHERAQSRYAMYNRHGETPTSFLIPVTGVWREDYDGPVYNMEVEVEHTYCVSRVAVHNCSLFGIDPAEMGFIFGNEGVKNQQYANSPLDRIISSKERGLRPFVRHFGSWLNSWLIKPYWPKIQLEFGGFDVQTAKEKDEADLQAVQHWMSPNEIRADRGRAPIDHPAADLPLNTLFQLEESIQPPPSVEFDSMGAWVNGERAVPQPFRDPA